MKLQDSRSHLLRTLGHVNENSSNFVSMSHTSAYNARPDTSTLFGEQTSGKKRAIGELPNQYAQMSHDNVCYDSGKWSNFKDNFTSRNISEMRNMDLERYEEKAYVDENHCIWKR